MKKVITFVMAAMLLFAPLTYAGSSLGAKNSPGPAPNSGDGISDGSGFLNNLILVMEILGVPFYGPGPAPNSGDGIPDGSGFDDPPQGAK